MASRLALEAHLLKPFPRAGAVLRLVRETEAVGGPAPTNHPESHGSHRPSRQRFERALGSGAFGKSRGNKTDPIPAVRDHDMLCKMCPQKPTGAANREVLPCGEGDAMI